MKRYSLAALIVFLIFQMGSASTEKSPSQGVAYRQKAIIPERTGATAAYLPLVFRQYTQPLDLEMAGQIGGRVLAVAVQGSYAYVGIGPRLTVFDVSDPSQPIQVGQTGVLPGSINTVTPSGNYVYIGSSGRLGVVDVSTPNDPLEVASIVFPGALTPELSYYPVSDVAVVGNYAYVAVELGGLRIIDLSIPTAPLEVGVYTATVSTGFVGVTVVGNYAYFANGVAGIRVIDISTPSAPIEIV